MAVEWEEGKKERKGGAHLINMDGDIVTGKAEQNGFWEYGGCCLGERCTGPTVNYVMSQDSEVVPTLSALSASGWRLFPDDIRSIHYSRTCSSPTFMEKTVPICSFYFWQGSIFPFRPVSYGPSGRKWIWADILESMFCSNRG